MVNDVIEILAHRPTVTFMTRLGTARSGLLTALLAIARGRLRRCARRLLRPLNLQHQINQLFLRQPLQITAIHTVMDSGNSARDKGVGSYACRRAIGQPGRLTLPNKMIIAKARLGG
jgi:hypothetical protein